MDSLKILTSINKQVEEMLHSNILDMIKSVNMAQRIWLAKALEEQENEIKYTCDNPRFYYEPVDCDLEINPFEDTPVPVPSKRASRAKVIRKKWNAEITMHEIKHYCLLMRMLKRVIKEASSAEYKERVIQYQTKRFYERGSAHFYMNVDEDKPLLVSDDNEYEDIRVIDKKNKKLARSLAYPHQFDKYDIPYFDSPEILSRVHDIGFLFQARLIIKSQIVLKQILQEAEKRKSKTLKLPFEDITIITQ